jgi:hypothetical protein
VDVGRGVDVGQSDPGSDVELFRVPGGPVFFQELDEILQKRRGVSQHGLVLRLETPGNRVSMGVLQTQVILQCKVAWGI